MVWFGGFGFWFGIFFHIGKEDRLRTIGFPQEKLQFPRNSHWKWDLDNLWTDWKGSLQTWHETRAWNPLLMQGQTDVGSTWGGDGIWLRLFHFLFSFHISVPEEITEQNWLFWQEQTTEQLLLHMKIPDGPVLLDGLLCGNPSAD